MRENDTHQEQDYLGQIDPHRVVLEMDFREPMATPAASVVVVTYNPTADALHLCLEGLNRQTRKDFEIIIVDNSDRGDIQPFLKGYRARYTKLNANYGLSYGRNVGIQRSKASVVIFLDDDAVPADDFIEKHIQAHENLGIFALRGKSIGRKRSIYNYLAVHYDLGDTVLPCYINLEGNSSFKKDILVEVGGFNPRISGAGGGEGLELSYRIFRRYGDVNKLVYYPHAVIHHDFCNSFGRYLRKQVRHHLCQELRRRQSPEIDDFRLNRFDRTALVKPAKPPNFIVALQVKLIQFSVIVLLKLWTVVRRSRGNDSGPSSLA